MPINNLIKPLVVVGSDKWGGESKVQENIRRCIENKSITCLKESSIQYVLKDKCTKFPDSYAWINESLVHNDKCVDVYLLNGVYSKEEVKISLRLVMGWVISFIT